MNDPQSGRSSRRDTTRAERLEVLRLLEGGDISASEADALLDALDAAEQSSARGSDRFAATPNARHGSVRVRISDPTTGKPHINLALPVGLVDAALNVARRFAPDKVPAVETIRQSIAAGVAGTLVDIVNQNERIEVIVEP
jgi:hypothetical protein